MKLTNYQYWIILHKKKKWDKTIDWTPEPSLYVNHNLFACNLTHTTFVWFTTNDFNPGDVSSGCIQSKLKYVAAGEYMPTMGTVNNYHIEYRDKPLLDDGVKTGCVHCNNDRDICWMSYNEECVFEPKDRCKRCVCLNVQSWSLYRSFKEREPYIDLCQYLDSSLVDGAFNVSHMPVFTHNGHKYIKGNNLMAFSNVRIKLFDNRLTVGHKFTYCTSQSLTVWQLLCNDQSIGWIVLTEAK